jgi:peptidoglycan/LPS O-acetylase OafA/YrhL
MFKPIKRTYEWMIDRLARVTTSGRRIRELDGLRFVAIASVFVQHVENELVAHFPHGTLPPSDLVARLVASSRFGVELFFLISGFILGMPFAAQHILRAKKVSLKKYYFRRVTRLEPPYILTLLLWYAILVLYWGKSARALLPHLVASLFYLHNVIYHQFSAISAVTWSLEIEVQFYILAPLLACVFLVRSRWPRRGILIAATILLQQVYKTLFRFAPTLGHIGGPGGTLLNYVAFFAMGFLLADVYLVDWKETPKSSLWADAIAIPGWLLLPFYFMPSLSGRVPGSALPYILFVLCWLSFRSVLTRKFLANSFIMTVGGMCYTIYLLHYPMIDILANYSRIPLGTGNLGLNVASYAILWGLPVLAASIVFFMAVEKPCMQSDWVQRLWARLRGRPLPAKHRGLSPTPSASPANQPAP